MSTSTTKTPRLSEHERKRQRHDKFDFEDEEFEKENLFGVPPEEPQKKRTRRSSGVLERTMPNILNASAEFGSPQKFWSSLCERDEAYVRDPHYLDKLTKLKPEMRVILLDWIINVCDELKLHRETYHLTLDFIDRYFTKLGARDAKKSAHPEQLQLIAVSSLLLATKIEEIYPPKLEQLIELTDNKYTQEQARRMEGAILQELEWHCSPVTAVQWLAFYLAADLQARVYVFSLEHAPFNMSMSSESQNRSRCPPITPSSDSPLQPLLNAPNDSVSTLASQELNASSRSTGGLDDGIPQIMRDDFIILTKMLDFCTFDMQFLRFTYSEISAALIMCFYEPQSQVESITGFRYRDLRKAIGFVTPIIKVIRADALPGIAIPHYDGVDARDVHNIQSWHGDPQSLLRRVEEARKEQEKAKAHRPAKRLF
ncbi:Cyclin N-terminal domain-containing protein [Aphelenchoides fujianensis]|nr:Cyclin N-terminal domain-containing protein [Aphelenchoides fujianensis]